MPKQSKPKKLSYRLIPRDSPTGRTLHALLADLIEDFHEELRDARIALAWNLAWRPDVDGRVILGQCRKASDLDRELVDYDFVIVLRKEFMEDPTVTDDQRRALLDHECCHATTRLDAEGEPVVDEKGRTVYRLRKHDLEEFAEIVARHGCYKRDLEAFAKALDRARQKVEAVGYVGRRSLQEGLRARGYSVPLDVIVQWSDAERRTVQAWLVLQHEMQGVELWQGQAQPMPECLKAAIDVAAAS